MHFLTKEYSPKYFAIWRILFGLYLAWLFVSILPYASEIFFTLNLHSVPFSIWGPFTLFNFIQSELSLTVCISIFAILSLLLAAGFYRRAAAFLLFYGWSNLFIQNSFTADPSLGFVGLLILALVVIPSGEPYSLLFTKPKEKWFMPGILYWGLWGVFAISFFISGYIKGLSPLWSSGSAMYYMLTSQIALQNPIVSLLASLPPAVINAFTWLVMFSQLIILPALMTSVTRFAAWLIVTLMFAGSLIILDLTDVLIGMLFFYAFLFDPHWLSFFKKGKKLA